MLLQSTSKKLRGTSPFAIYTFQSLFFNYIYASTYAFLGQYLNVEGHQYQSMNTLLRNAWSMKCFFSFISDSVPICGLRRLPYISIGLCIIFLSSCIMFLLPMPEPYFDSYTEIDSNGNSNCSRDLNVIRNPDAPNSALPYAILFGIAYTCMAWSDCCIDGLITQKSMLEEESKRGRFLTAIKIVEKLAAAFFAMFFATFYNKVDYGGRFCTFGLEFNQISLVVSVGCIVTLIYTIIFTNERDIDTADKHVGFKGNFSSFWEFLQTTHFLKLLAYRMFVSILFGFSTPAKSKVEIRWVGVEPLVKGYQSVLINLLSALGMYIFRRFFINSNWRKLIAILTMIEIGLRGGTETLALFGVIRNQFLWYADDLVFGLFHMWIFFTSSLIVIEYAPQNLEGTSFAVMWSVAACSGAIGSAFGNIMFSFFDVVNDERYIRDSELDRKMVFYTFCIDWFFAFSTIGFVFLLPTQKPMARKWREEGEKTANKKTAICLLLFVCSGFGFSLVLSAFTFFEETRCLIIAGGAGC